MSSVCTPVPFECELSFHFSWTKDSSTAYISLIVLFYHYLALLWSSQTSDVATAPTRVEFAGYTSPLIAMHWRWNLTRSKSPRTKRPAWTDSGEGGIRYIWQPVDPLALSRLSLSPWRGSFRASVEGRTNKITGERMTTCALMDREWDYDVIRM